MGRSRSSRAAFAPLALLISIPEPSVIYKHRSQDSTSSVRALPLSVESWKGRLDDLQSLYMFLA